MSRQDKATTEKHARVLRELVKKPDNKICADCKRNDARWASWNIGVFVCIRCSGIHRSMGTHISKVKSVDLDMWTPEQMASIMKWGNRRGNLYWEAHLKPGHSPPDHKLESFIRSKYESRRWAMDGPPPEDPSVLESGDGESASAAPEPEAPPPPAAKPASPPPASSLFNPGAARVARSLLSTAAVSANRNPTSAPAPAARPAAAAAAAPPAPAPAPKPQDDLFSLDFHAAPSPPPASSTPANAMRKDDIMSLFSRPAQPVAGVVPGATADAGWGFAAPTQPAQPAAADPWGSFTSSTPATNPVAQQQAPTTSQWGWPQQAPGNPGLASQNVWSAPAASTQPANNLFGNNIWSTTTTATSTASDPFGAFTAPASGTNTTSAKKDDPFGDIWK